MTKKTLYTKPKPTKDIVVLESGLELDLLNIDFSKCRTVDELNELDIILQEKVIEIDFQIECYNQGYHPDGTAFSPERPPPILWEPRAKKAMAWTKLQKQEINLLRQRLAKNKDKVDFRVVSEVFVDLCHLVMPKDQFDDIMGRAKQLGRQVAEGNGK